MGRSEDNITRERRRAAVRQISSLSRYLPEPKQLVKDAGVEAIETLLSEIGPVLDSAEDRAFLEAAIHSYNEATGNTLFAPQYVQPLQPPQLPVATRTRLTTKTSVAMHQPAPDPPAPQAASVPPPRQVRIRACDVNCTYNSDFIGNMPVDVWFEVNGPAFVEEFLHWATVILPSRFKERVKRTSLTIEESTHADKPTIHLHAQFTFSTAIDRDTNDGFLFRTIRPHVEVNSARGKDVWVSRARVHFYVYCNKIGSLWNYTDYHPFIDYEAGSILR
jgi:hypothetical protein